MQTISDISCRYQIRTIEHRHNTYINILTRKFFQKSTKKNKNKIYVFVAGTYGNYKGNIIQQLYRSDICTWRVWSALLFALQFIYAHTLTSHKNFIFFVCTIGNLPFYFHGIRTICFIVHERCHVQYYAAVMSAIQIISTHAQK